MREHGQGRASLRVDHPHMRGDHGGEHLIQIQLPLSHNALAGRDIVPPVRRARAVIPRLLQLLHCVSEGGRGRACSMMQS